MNIKNKLFIMCLSLTTISTFSIANGLTNTWENIYNTSGDKHDSFFGSLSQNKNGDIYSVYVGGIPFNPTQDDNLFGTLYWGKIVNNILDLNNSGNINVTSPFTAFDYSGNLVIFALEENNKVLIENTGHASQTNTQIKVANSPKLTRYSNNLYSLENTSSFTPIVPEWYGVNTYSVDLDNSNRDNRIYIGYNKPNNPNNNPNDVTVNLTTCTLDNPGQCCGNNDKPLKDGYSYSYFSSLNKLGDSEYVAYNEYNQLDMSDMHASVKKITVNNNNIDLGHVCGDILPQDKGMHYGKIVSRPLQLTTKDGNNYLVVAYVQKSSSSEVSVSLKACNLANQTNEWQDFGKITGPTNLKQAIWYPQIVNYNNKDNNTIAAFIRKSKDGGDCTGGDYCEIYASKLDLSSNQWKWLPIGLNDGLVSHGYNDSDLENPTVQNGSIYVNFLASKDNNVDGTYNAVVRKYNEVNNTWEDVCQYNNTPSNARRWGQGAGGFILHGNDYYITYNEMFADSGSGQSGSYYLNIDHCTQ